MGKSSITHFRRWSAGPGAYRASSSAQNKAFGKFTFRAMGMSHLEKTPTSSKKKKKKNLRSRFYRKLFVCFRGIELQQNTGDKTAVYNFVNEVAIRTRYDVNNTLSIMAVSYTHLTLPTRRTV